MQVYKAAIKTSSETPRFNSMVEAQRINRSLELLQVHARQIIYGNVSTIKGKEFKHTAVKKDEKKCFTNVGLGIHYNYCT